MDSGARHGRRIEAALGVHGGSLQTQNIAFQIHRGMQWPKRRLIAVVGATGAQGGGLVRAILSGPQGGFAARALARDVNSDKAKALAKLGAEVVAADVDDVESLKKAFQGAYGAYCVTFYWEHFSPEREFAEASNMAHAAKHAGIEHVIWSTLEDTRQWVPLSDDPACPH